MQSLARWVVKLASAARTSDGLIDLHARRYMLFGEYYGQLYANGMHWSGSPGRRLSFLTRSQDEPAVALWLVELLGGVTDAQELEPEEVRGASCQRFVVSLDASRLPDRWRTSDDAIQPTVWIDENQYVRRIEVHAEGRSHRLELWDFGSWVSELSWTRLPTVRSAQTAECPARADSPPSQGREPTTSPVCE